MDQQTKVEMHFMPVEGMTYFLATLFTVEDVEGVEVVRNAIPNSVSTLHGANCLSQLF